MPHFHMSIHLQSRAPYNVLMQICGNSSLSFLYLCNTGVETPLSIGPTSSASPFLDTSLRFFIPFFHSLSSLVRQEKKTNSPSFQSLFFSPLLLPTTTLRPQPFLLLNHIIGGRQGWIARQQIPQPSRNKIPRLRLHKHLLLMYLTAGLSP